MRIRPGQRTDVPWLCAQLRAFAAAYPAPLPLYGGDDHAERILDGLLGGGNHLLVVAETDTGNPVGFLAASILPHPFAVECVLATEWWWWVVPASRGSRAGLLLLDAFERWADAQGVPTHLTTEATSALNDRHLLRRGYAPVERHWLRFPAGRALAMSPT